MAREELAAFFVIHRATFREFLDEPSCGSRGIEKQRPGRLAAGILPRMWDITRYERACSGAADGYLIADLEGELARKDPGYFITVMVEMVQARGAGRQSLLEHHDALIGLASEKLQMKRTAGRWRVDMLPAACGDNEALCCIHLRIPPCGRSRISLTGIVHQSVGRLLAATLGCRNFQTKRPIRRLTGFRSNDLETVNAALDHHSRLAARYGACCA